MNKIFKVVWSKTKECYVVVSEVAKNNGGKKKVLASVLATLAIMGAGAQMGTPVQAGANNSGTSVNLWGDKKLDGTNNSANIVGAESVAIGTNLRAGSSTAASTDPAHYTHTPGGRYGGNAIAIGKDSSAHDDRNIAIGYKNTTEGQDSVAMGSNVIAGTGQSIAIGSSNTDETTGVVTQTIARGKVNIVNGRPGPAAAIAIGAGAQALDGSGVLAMGQLAYASGNNNVAIGTQTNVNGSNATAIGSTAQALGRSSAAYGTQAFANGLGAVAVGPGANAGVSNSTGTIDGEREGATAVGRGSRATDKAATAIGWSANASKQNATALGYGSIANIAGGVALGSESKTTKDAGETGYNPATGRTNDYNNLTNNTKAALTSTRAAVSIGDNSANITRQLTGLAAGTQDTDAVNVAQLKAVNLKFAGDSTQVTGSTDVRLNDGTFNVNGDGTLISTEATATGIKVKAKVGGTITNDSSNDGKAKAPTTDGIATTTNVTNAINNSGWKVTSSNNGGTTNGTSVEKVSPGDKVTFSAGKNIVLDQNGKQFTYSLSDTVALTNTGSLTVGSTKVSNGGVTITAPTGGTTTNVTLTQSGLDNGGNKIVNVKDGDVSATSKDAVNGSQLHAVKTAERHIAPTTAGHEYTVDSNGDVTMTYLDGNNNAVTGEQAVIKGIAKNDLSNITNEGKKVITGLSNKVVAGDNITVDETEDATTKQKTYKVNAKLAKLEDGTNTTVSGNGTAANPYHVNVAGDLTGISSITNGGTNNGKISFGPNKTVTVDGDHSITLNASTGKIGGLQNLTFDPTNFTSGQAATEDQLKSVHDTLKASELHIAPTESNRTGEHIAGAATSNTAAGAAANAYKYDATTKQVVLEYNDGTGANKTGTKAVIDFSALNTGAGASSWNIASDKVSTTEGTVAAGSAATQNIADGKTVTMKAGKNLTVKQENVGGNASVAFSLDKDLKDLDSVTTNKTITKEITLKDPNGGSTSTTIKKDGDRITYTNDGSTTVNKVANLADEKHITPGTYSVDSTGKVTMTYTDGNNTLVPNTTTVIDGLVTKKLDNIDNDGKKTITGLGTIVKAGDNVTVSEAADATTGQKTYTVNAVTPAVYTKADGTKVVKRSDGTYTTNLDGSSGNDVAASDVIISFQDAAGDTKNATSIVNNVGSAIKNQTGGDFLTKLDNANTATPNAAVNVSDLKNTADGLTNKGLKFDANSGGVKTNKLGSTVKVQGAGTSADANYSGTNIKTFIDQDTTGNTTIDVKLDKNLTGINSISNTTTGPKMEFGGNSINITGGSLNMGGSNITNLKSGIVNNNATDDTNAANIGDVKKIAKDSDLHIAPTAGTTNNVAEYTVDANNKVTLTYQDGNGTAVTAPKAVIDLSALANKITSGYTFNTNAIAKGGTVDGSASVKAVDNGGTINYAAGKNLTVKQEIDATAKTHTYTYSLNKDLTNLDKVVVNGENGTNGKDGVTIIGPQGATGATGMPGTNGIDGKVGITGKDGKDAVSISGKDGIGTIGLTGPQGPAGQDGRGVDITTDHGTQTLNKPEANNNNQSERIVYVPKDKDGNPLKDDAGNTIKREVATMDDGLKFAGDDGQANQATNANVIKKQLNNVVDIIGGATKADLTTNNIGVNNDGNGKLLVQLSKNLNGINTVKNGNTTITLNDAPGGATNTPAVTISGGNLSVGGNKVTNVDDGTNDSDAVNLKQLKAAKTEVKAGENVTVKHTTDATDNHNIYTVSAVTPAVYTKADGTKVYKIVDPTSGAVTWNTSPDGNGTVVNAGDVITSFETPANGTTPGSTTGGTMIVNNVGSAINGKTGATYLDKLNAAAGDNNTKHAAVNVTDLKSTADALKSNELHIRPTTSGRTGETVNQGAGGTAESYKYDATTKSVTLKYNDGTGAGVTGTEAKIDLSDLANQITSGYTFKANATANGGTVANDATTPAVATTVENGGTINYAAGKNLTVKQDIDTTAKTHTYTYGLNKDLTNLDKVVVNGENGTNGKDGVTIIGPQGATGATGMPGTNGIDGKVGIAGKDGKDAVSISGKDGVGHIGLQGPKGTPGTPGADGASLDITTDHGTQTLTKPEANNGGKSERIVYVPKDKDGNPLKDDAGNTIKREVATMDDGLKFTGNNESTENKHKLGSLVKVQGEGVTENTTTNKLEANGEEFKSASGNIAVVADSIDKLTVKLNKNLAGINKISNGGSSITLNDTPSATTPAVTITGGNLSMGDGTTNNKIVNLAPGTDDNDAVNYKQLKAAKTEVKAGENVTVKHTTDGTDNHNIYTVSAVTPAVYTKADGTKVYKIVDPTTGAVTWNTKADGTGTNVNAGDVITSFETPANGTTPGSTTGGTMIVNNIGSAIKNQTGGDFLTKLDNANTATPNAAVNVSDLKSTADALKANERHIAPTTVATGSTENKGGTANAAGTANVYKYDAASKTVTLTYNDGNGNAVTDTKAVIDLSNLSTGGTGASSWNIASDKVSATEGAVATGSAGTQNIADGKTVTMKAGKNLTVNQVNDGAGNASVAFSLDKNLENLDKVVVNGNDGATGQAGVSIVGPKGANGVDGNDGKVGIAGKDGKDAVSISGKDGVGHIGLQGPKGTPGTPGADGASLDISTDHGTQTLVKPEANNNDKSERIVYVPKDANGNPLKDTDGNTIKREVATMDDGLKFTGNNTGTVNKHKLGSLVKVQGEGVSATDEAAFVSASGNIAVTAENNDTLTIRLNKNLKGLNSIQLGGNTIQSNGDNITFTTNGGTTKTVATTDQLWTIQANGTDVPAKSGKVNLVAGDHITITPDAANGKMTISATGFGSMDGFNVKTSAESTTVGTHAGDTTENIKNGKTVDMQAGKNLVVTQTNDGNGNTTVNYALNKDVDLGTNGSLKAGDTTINKDGVTIANGPSVTKTGVDAGDKKITNVADGDVNATSKDAVNGSQLKKYTDAAKTTVEAGDNNVKVDADNTAADGHTNYKVSLKPVVTIGDTHKVTIDGHTGDITGLTNVNLTDPTFATKGRAATEEQLDKVLTEAKKKAVEKVQAGTAAAGDTNIATVAPKAGDTFGTAGATYEVSVSKNAVKDAAKEAVKVTSASPAITVTADNTTPHETTYKVGFDGNQAATQIPLTYKQNGGNTRTVKLSDGLNFIDGTNTKARTAADGKVTFDVMGDLTGITSISNAAGGPKMTFGGNSINVTNGDLNMGGNKITNLGKGTATTDAATVGQLTKVTSNNHSVVINKTTDANGAPVYDLAVTGTPGAPAVDPRIDQLGEEIGRVGAQGAALSALKPIQYDPLEPTQIMAGYGNYRGNSAIAMGVAHYKNESTLMHAGVSWAGGSRHMMANAGVTWKVGNRDSEAAVADRYRKGPISSAYAMQQEMAAMKAQNAGLKGEVSDLKAENEQMKAQIAAMMAKLGL